MTVQSDIRAAIITWNTALVAYNTQLTAMPALNAAVATDLTALRTAVTQIIALQVIDLVPPATALNAAYAALDAAEAHLISLRQAVDDAATAISVLIAPVFGGYTNVVMQIFLGGLQR